ncbi:MAG: carboxypeptidase M32 [Oligoflexia bacterium]|nr:carboxypeptidase M32 [Oligoflexia bacterium]
MTISTSTTTTTSTPTSMPINNQLQPLVNELKELAHLNAVSALLDWDRATYMPNKSIDIRSEQMALIGRLVHEKHTGEKIRSLLSEHVDLNTGNIRTDKIDKKDKKDKKDKEDAGTTNYTEKEKRLLKETYRSWRIANGLPTEFVAELSKLLPKAMHVWEEAKEKKDFNLFAPYLEKIIDAKRKEADYIGWSKAPYDALLDQYEPGTTQDEISIVFEDLKKGTLELLNKIKASPNFGKENRLKNVTHTFDLNKQWDFGLKVLEAMGIDFNYLRQDKSAHPFSTSLHPTDVRITTRMCEKDFLESLTSTIHEGGHALYELGLPVEWYGTPLGEARSMGIHESQSRLFENIIGRGRSFWTHYYPILKSYFPKELVGVSVEDLYYAFNEIIISPVRLKADELTYNLHIIIRFEIEKLIINDSSVKVFDLPEIWNQKYQEYLGVTPKDHAEGILQDVHWSGGMMGYFPSYTLGNIYGLQFYKQATKELGNLNYKFEKGNLKELTGWLKEKIYQKGKEKSVPELLLEITGEKLNTRPLLDYLENKYKEIYNF